MADLANAFLHGNTIRDHPTGWGVKVCGGGRVNISLLEDNVFARNGRGDVGGRGWPQDSKESDTFKQLEPKT